MAQPEDGFRRLEKGGNALASLGALLLGYAGLHAIDYINGIEGIEDPFFEDKLLALQTYGGVGAAIFAFFFAYASFIRRRAHQFAIGVKRERNRLRTGSCFAPDTLVDLADGSKKLIRDIKIGDIVLAQTRFGKQTKDVVTKVFVHSGKHQTLVINNSLIVTPNHPIAVRYLRFFRKWVHAESLKIGDVLFGVDGPLKVNSIAPSTELFTVFNLTVGTYHTYFAGGVLVHNKG